MDAAAPHNSFRTANGLLDLINSIRAAHVREPIIVGIQEYVYFWLAIHAEFKKGQHSGVWRDQTAKTARQLSLKALPGSKFLNHHVPTLIIVCHIKRNMQ